MQYLLLFTIFLVSTCGLIYELVAGTLASYLLGDSVTQFSTVIGSYLFAMGIGSWLSKYIRKNLIAAFITVEMITGLVGGMSSAILFLAFGYSYYFRFILYLLVVLTGVLVGLEIPLIMRIMKRGQGFSTLIANVFTFDYIGALLASIAFPIILVPYLNLTRTSMLFGLFNVSLALYLSYFFRQQLRQPTKLFLQGICVALLLVIGFIYAGKINLTAEEEIYGENILYATNSAYQRIVITRDRNAYSLFLNNHLQFNSKDEYRYHEALVHPAMASGRHRKVLIMGGGDGLAAREILKYPDVESITLVDLDPKLTELFTKNEVLARLNNHSFSSSKLKLIRADAFEWLKRTPREAYDVIIIDFPDPSNFSVGKLFTNTFYQLLHKKIDRYTRVVVQSTSPLYAKKSFWCINSTIASTGLHTIPYHTYVPSFGEWGYVLCGIDLHDLHIRGLPRGLKYMSPNEFPAMKKFSADMYDTSFVVNKLSNQALIPIFEEEWDKAMMN